MNIVMLVELPKSLGPQLPCRRNNLLWIRDTTSTTCQSREIPSSFGLACLVEGAVESSSWPNGMFIKYSEYAQHIFNYKANPLSNSRQQCSTNTWWMTLQTLRGGLDEAEMAEVRRKVAAARAERLHAKKLSDIKPYSRALVFFGLCMKHIRCEFCFYSFGPTTFMILPCLRPWMSSSQSSGSPWFKKINVSPKRPRNFPPTENTCQPFAHCYGTCIASTPLAAIVAVDLLPVVATKSGELS